MNDKTGIIPTPAAAWRVAGEPDPHANRYDGERSNLVLGSYTDDELANEVFLHDHSSLNIKAILRGEPSSIVFLTAAKERIRWLSRHLEAAASQRDELLAALEAVVAIADRKTDVFDQAHAAIAKAKGGAQ